MQVGVFVSIVSTTIPCKGAAAAPPAGLWDRPVQGALREHSARG
jgi:hypothetical protein